MSSKVLSSLVDVDSRGVLVEISIDGESGLNWSVGHDLGLDGSDVGSNGVGTLSLEQDAVVWLSSVSGDAVAGASWGGGLLGWAVKSARGQEVWLAPSGISISISSDDTGVNPVSPSLNGVSSSASVSAGSAAGKDVLHGVSVVGGLVGTNTNSVSDSLSSTESPARSAVSLVSDLTNRGAVWPLLLGGEAGWDVSSDSGDDWDGVFWGSQLVLSEFQGSVHSSDGLEVVLGPSGVVLGLPG